MEESVRASTLSVIIGALWEKQLLHTHTEQVQCTLLHHFLSTSDLPGEQ